MHNKSISAFFIIGIAVIASLFLGVNVVNQQTGTLLGIVGIAGMLFCTVIGQKIWLLLLFLLATDIPLIRGLDTQQLGQMLFIGFSALMFLMRRLRADWGNITESDFWRTVIALVILQAYIRNPVGLNVLGSGSVGGRPYILAAIALATGIILSKYRVPVSEIKWAMPLSILAAIMNFPLSWARYRVAGGGGGDPVGAVTTTGVDNPGAATRIGRYQTMASVICQVVSSRVNPLKASFHPVWGPLILLSLFFAAASGYRNAVAWVGLIYLCGVAYWGRLPSVIISFALGGLLLGMVALLNLAYPLPPNVQRALSPFPGTWNERYVDNANISSEWRYEMWIEALTSDKWIKNKILGDGLGFTREELERMRDIDLGNTGNYAGSSGLTRQQENMLIQGSYHSGPVQTIRVVGYFGLLLILIAMTRLSVNAHRLIMRCRGTEWQTMAYFFGIPIIIKPIFFLFIFGTFDDAVVHICIYSAIIDMLHLNLPLPAYVPRSRAPLPPPAFARRRSRGLPST